jgi:phosphoserine aminotransferase
MPSDFSDQIRSKVGNVPIVCDMSSNILSRPVNVSNFGVVFAGAQKNLGAAGVTIVIVRKDLIHLNPARIPPLMMDYKTFSKSSSLYNTPPTFSIYVTGKVLKWIKDTGLEGIYARNKQKAQLLYAFIKESKIYKCPVNRDYQSTMNVPFRIWINEQVNEALESDFLSLCSSSNLVGLSGHRSVGGIRASLYNAMTVSGVEALIKLMKEFEEKVLLKSPNLK